MLNKTPTTSAIRKPLAKACRSSSSNQNASTSRFTMQFKRHIALDCRRPGYRFWKALQKIIGLEETALRLSAFRFTCKIYRFWKALKKSLTVLLELEVWPSQAQPASQFVCPEHKQQDEQQRLGTERHIHHALRILLLLMMRANERGTHGSKSSRNRRPEFGEMNSCDKSY